MLFDRLRQKIRRFFVNSLEDSIKKVLDELNHQRKDRQFDKVLIAKQYITEIKAKGIVDRLEDVEFKAFSQQGEDGIIQYLINSIDIPNKTFVEFGVENYEESNTRFLLLNNNWSGLVLDGSRPNIDYIKNDFIYWMYDIQAESFFITRENINETLIHHNIKGDIGLLSIDIDGNDYWVWKEIECIKPYIVVCEYNSLFGSERPITVPYESNFYLTDAHYSNLYFGASLSALCHLAEEKGYYLVGSNSFGSNAFFVRKDKIGDLKVFSACEAYVESKFRSSRDKDGRLTFKGGKARMDLLKGVDVFNVVTNQTEKL